MSSSIIESVSESESHNSSFSNNEADSPIKQKRKRLRIQLLCAEELSEEQPPESYERKLDIVENGKNKEADDTEKNLKKQKKKKRKKNNNNIFTFRLTLKGRLLLPLKSS